MIKVVGITGLMGSGVDNLIYNKKYIKYENNNNLWFGRSNN